MAVISNINSSAPTSTTDNIYNPSTELSSDQFMQLFLTQLQLQDPTNPMDTDKMLEQTAYMTTMEMNQKMETTLDKLSNSLLKTNQMNTINAIGKMADTGNRYLNVTDDDTDVNFDLYFGSDITSGNIEIKDKNGNIVRTLPLEAHTKGVLNFDWDLKDNNGNRVPSDTYEITATYTDPDGNSHTTALGAYPIESIKFENGEAYAKLGSNYFPFSEIKEIYEWQE